MFPTPRKGKRSQEVKLKENIEKPFTTNPFKSQGEFYAQTKSESREPERIVVRSLSRIGNTDNRKITELDAKMNIYDIQILRKAKNGNQAQHQTLVVIQQLGKKPQN